ncbi:MAG: hypothetical protein ACREN2_07260 [Candidatus Dormibacteria bacterium]
MPQQRRSTDPRPPRSASRRKRERRRDAELRRATAPAPRRRWWIAGGTGAAVALVVVLLVLLTRGHATPSTTKPTPAPTPVPSALASLSSAGGTAAVGGITCDSSASSSATSTSTSSTTTSGSTTATAHLAVYVNGGARLVPAGIGVGTPHTTASTDDGPLVSGPCYYWINTRTQDGLIHVQAPQPGPYTLGQLFDLWGQPLSTTQAGPASGAVTVLVNGSQYSGDPRAVPLTQHAVIQVDVGSATPFTSYSFPAGQ